MASSSKGEGSHLTKEGDEKKTEDSSNKGKSTTERVSDIPELLLGDLVEYLVCHVFQFGYKLVCFEYSVFQCIIAST